MKKILAKIAGVATMFAMSFGMVLAQSPAQVTICHQTGNGSETIIINGNALQGHLNHGDTQGPCEGDETPNQEVCESMTYMSDDADASLQVDAHNAVAVAPINSGWTASIPGAEWVWSEVNVTDATVDITKTFTKTFTISGTPTGGTLDIAADNAYEVSVNGNVDVFVDALENNYASGATAVPGDGQDSYVIPAAYLQNGSNTITFEVKNMGIAGSNSLDNPAGLMYKLSVDCTPIVVEETVCVEGNLVANGGFEMPVVTHANGWDIYDSGTAGLGWSVAWNGAFVGAPATAKLELHNAVAGWLHDEGSQHAELDADWGMNDGEQASVVISQELVTVPGEEYVLSYAFSPRPDTIAAENKLEVLVEGVLVQTQGPVAGGANTSWTTYTYNFTATDNSTTLAFKDAGTANSVGTFLDDVSVNCDNDQECVPGNPEMLYARINMKTDDATKLRNWGAGDMAANVYVGGNTLANQYDMGEWFPLTNPDGSFISDADIATYRDVAGLAVQRMDGKVRVVLYGFHESETAGKELAAGSIELSSDPNPVKTRLLGAWTKGNGYVDPMNAYTRAHDVTVNDAANAMDGRGDFVGNINQYNPRFDNVRVFQDLFQFHLVATTNSDGFYADYNFDSVEETTCQQTNAQ